MNYKNHNKNLRPGRLGWLGLGALLVLLASCSDCVRERCAYPSQLLMVVDGATGMPLADAIVTGGGQVDACVSDGPCTHAVWAGGPSGSLTVSRAGFKSVEVSYTTTTDDCGNLVRQRRVVTLEPESSGAPSTAAPPSPDSAGCNAR